MICLQGRIGIEESPDNNANIFFSARSLDHSPACFPFLIPHQLPLSRRGCLNITHRWWMRSNSDNYLYYFVFTYSLSTFLFRPHFSEVTAWSIPKRMIAWIIFLILSVVKIQVQPPHHSSHLKLPVIAEYLYLSVKTLNSNSYISLNTLTPDHSESSAAAIKQKMYICWWKHFNLLLLFCLQIINKSINCF